MTTPRRPLRAALFLVALASLSGSAAHAALDDRGFIDSFLPIPASVMNTIGQLIPERDKTGASYLSDTYNPNLFVRERATVTVTFVHEGAGYRNSVGYFTFGFTGETVEILDRQLIFPNASYADPNLGWGGGRLQSGDTVTLRDSQGLIRVFEPGEYIGLFIVPDGWNGSSVKGWDPAAPALPHDTAAGNLAGPTRVYTTIDTLNPEVAVGRADVARHAMQLHMNGLPGFLDGEGYYLTSFEDLPRDGSSDNDFNDVVLIVRSTPETAVVSLSAIDVAGATSDPDGDGVAGLRDEFPTDPTRAFTVRTPPQSFDTVVFEDAYPSPGDADFNDVVVQYAYDEVTDAAGGLRDLAGTFHLVARGAGFDHAFGVAVHGLPAEVSGLVRVQRFDTALVMTDDASRPLADFITVDDHGQTIARFDHLFPSTRRALPPLPGASFTNTSTAAPQVSPASVRIVVTFDQPIPRAPLGGSPYDPYLLVAHGTERYDIHLPGRHGFPDRPMHLPPESSGLTYVDARQYPWAMVVPFDWRFPLERVHINDGNAHTAAYPDFKAWRQSGGAQQADWYKRPNLTASTPRVADSLASGVRTRPWTLTAGH